MKLYTYWRSSCSWRARIALAYKKVDWEPVPVHLKQGAQHDEAYRAVTPMAQVPTLEWEEDGQTRRLSQSMAILELLEERFPEPSLLPSDPYLRARARQLALDVATGIQPLQNLATMQRLKELGVDPMPWSVDCIARGLAAVERSAADVAGRFLVGDAPSFADICLVPQVYNARRFGLDMSTLPLLVRVDAACAELPAFQVSHPDRQVDAPSAEERTP